MSKKQFPPRGDGVTFEMLAATDLGTLTLPYATEWVECVYHPTASIDVHDAGGLAGLAVNIEVANRELVNGHVKATGGAGLYPITYGSALCRVVITAGTGKCAITYAGTPQAG